VWTASGLQRYWYADLEPPIGLRGLAHLYCHLAWMRRTAYSRGVFAVHRLPVPVIVVGNLTVGGTGKTPLVIHLAALLREAGHFPGIVARGYGGQSRSWPRSVTATTDPAEVGDEAVLLARRTGRPVWVGPRRVTAARALLAAAERCDVLVADDGLQHYAMGRDLEIVVVDSVRGHGNGACLPAGPLREPLRRLAEVTLVMSNGRPTRGMEAAMELVPGTAVNLADPTRRVGLESFAGQPVHAVAGVGHPARYFSMLRRFGLQVLEHPFPDHHRFITPELEFEDAGPVIMTEKDAVKGERLALADRSRYWYLPVSARLNPTATHSIGRLLPPLFSKSGDI